MAANQELVGEFRQIVDSVIQQQVDYCNGLNGGLLRSWPKYDKTVNANGMLFVSLDGDDGRYSHIPYSREHIWGVAPSEEQKLGSYTGHLAIVSFDNKEEELFRSWSFDSAMNGIDVSTVKGITEITDLEDILDWVKSPHLFSGNLARSAQLEPDEITQTDSRLHQLAERRAALDVGLDNLARQRRRPMPNIRVN